MIISEEPCANFVCCNRRDASSLLQIAKLTSTLKCHNTCSWTCLSCAGHKQCCEVPLWSSVETSSVIPLVVHCLAASEL